MLEGVPIFSKMNRRLVAQMGNGLRAVDPNSQGTEGPSIGFFSTGDAVLASVVGGSAFVRKNCVRG
jgi:tetrahydromethanopterin S-methyltransferase subunit C